MERVLSSDERLRKAEEMYYRRKGIDNRENNKKTNAPLTNKKYLLKKMIIQITICFVVYCSYYVVKNCNFIFSKEFINKTNEILSYDINFGELYCKVANYINNYSFFNKKEGIPEENKEEEGKQEESNQEQDTNNEEETHKSENDSVGENNTDTLAVAEAIKEETNEEENKLTQMQLDAKDIKENYSLINPLIGQITSRFGSRAQTEKVVSPYHVGIDIAANTGTNIVASMEGTVVVSEELGGYGKCIQIKKDDILTIYGHCSKLCVNKGDVVAKGQKIAEVGETRKCNRTSFTF